MTLPACAVAILVASGVALPAQDPGRTEQTPVQFGGNDSGLDARRQKLVAECGSASHAAWISGSRVFSQ